MKNHLSVEGWIDKSIVRSILKINKSLPEIDINHYGGFNNLISDIYNTIEAEDRKSVGIIVDANDHPTGRWRAVSDQVRRAGMNVPDYPDHRGVIINGIPRVGIWLMPDNRSPGEIEDFVSRLIPDEDPMRILYGRIPKVISMVYRRMSASSLQINRPRPRPMLGCRQEGDLVSSVRLSIVRNWI